MSKITKQIHRIYTVSALSSFQLAGASWVALLAARGFSLAQIGIAEGVFHVASLLFEIPSGVISDVFGRKRSMILSQCMFLLSSLLMIVSEGIGGVCVSLVCSAFGYNFASGTREALAYDTLKSGGREGEYLRYSSMEFTIYRIGSACAILCAGLALALGYRLANLLDMIVTGICLVFCVRLEEIRVDETPSEGTVSRRLLGCFRESLVFLTHNGRSIALMLWNALAGSIAVLTAFFLQARLSEAGLPGPWLGPALFVISLGGAIGAKTVTAMEKWDYRHISLLCILGIGGALVLSLWELPGLMILGGFLGNLFDDLLQIRTDALLNERFPSAQRATLVSVSSLCFSVVMILMSPLMGWLLS